MSRIVRMNGVENNNREISDDVKEKYSIFEDKEYWKKTSKLQREQEWNESALPHKAASIAFLFCIMFTVTFSFISFLSNVSTTIELQGIWLVLSILLLASLCGSSLFLFITKKEKLSNENSLFKSTVSFLVGGVGSALLCSTAVFSGLPSVLHYLTSEKGELVVTVIDKKESSSRYQCSPGLIIKEFTWYGSDRICPERTVYKNAQIGNEILITGNVSSFGVEAHFISQ